MRTRWVYLFKQTGQMQARWFHTRIIMKLLYEWKQHTD